MCRLLWHTTLTPMEESKTHSRTSRLPGSGYAHALPHLKTSHPNHSMSPFYLSLYICIHICVYIYMYFLSSPWTSQGKFLTPSVPRFILVLTRTQGFALLRDLPAGQAQLHQSTRQAYKKTSMTTRRSKWSISILSRYAWMQRKETGVQ